MKITRRNFLGTSTAAGACTALSSLVTKAQQPADWELEWPPNQALPSFRAPVYLDAANIQQLTGDQQVLLTTLQGMSIVANRGCIGFLAAMALIKPGLTHQNIQYRY